MFQALLQDSLEGPGSGKGCLDQDAAAAVKEGIPLQLLGRRLDSFSRRELWVYMDVSDIGHRGRVYDRISASFIFAYCAAVIFPSL